MIKLQSYLELFNIVSPLKNIFERLLMNYALMYTFH